MSADVVDALTSFASESTFATRLTTDPDDLRIRVDGVGLLALPVSRKQAQELCAVGRPAAFGRGEDTLYDESVRSTWEVAASRVKIDQRQWKRALSPALTAIASDLGVGGELDVVLNKLLVYGPGQFFAVHQDSERSDDMIGSLIVVLPSKYTGGTLVVHHNNETKKFARTRSAANKLTWIAFYGDCHHEVKALDSGHRVALTYHLVRRKGTSLAAELQPRALDRLEKAVRSYFSTPTEDPFQGDDEPDRLVFLLDHQYTQRGLDWDRLKGVDRVRAAALAEVAERVDCERYLALAEVHEVWDCHGPSESGGHRSFGGWGRRRRAHTPRNDDGGEQSGNGDRYELGELLNSEVELCHWVDRTGATSTSLVTTVVWGSEVCFTRSNSDLKPFNSEYEGYMGNYGNTLDRWYHRAAIVVWPRERDFKLRAEVSPEWALSQLMTKLEDGRLAEAQQAARSILPCWDLAARRAREDELFAQLVRVTLKLEDPELALALLAPFDTDQLNSHSLPDFAAHAECYGGPWLQRLFELWGDPRHGWSTTWLPLLPNFVGALEDSYASNVGSFVDWLLDSLVKAFIVSLARDVAHYNDLACESRLDDAIPLLRACGVADNTTVCNRVVAFLSQPLSEVPLLAVGAFAERAQKAANPSRAPIPGVAEISSAFVERARRVLSEPERAATDWSIDFALSCSCALCVEFAEFLSSRDRAEFDWPLAKDRRRHIHDIIDRHRLPIKHATKRVGRPYCLQLAKKPMLFRDEQKLRRRYAELVEGLEGTTATSSYERAKGRKKASRRSRRPT